MQVQHRAERWHQALVQRRVFQAVPLQPNHVPDQDGGVLTLPPVEVAGGGQGVGRRRRRRRRAEDAAHLRVLPRRHRDGRPRQVHAAVARWRRRRRQPVLPAQLPDALSVASEAVRVLPARRHPQRRRLHGAGRRRLQGLLQPQVSAAVWGGGGGRWRRRRVAGRRVCGDEPRDGRPAQPHQDEHLPGVRQGRPQHARGDVQRADEPPVQRPVLHDVQAVEQAVDEQVRAVRRGVLQRQRRLAHQHQRHPVRGAAEAVLRQRLPRRLQGQPLACDVFVT